MLELRLVAPKGAEIDKTAQEMVYISRMLDIAVSVVFNRVELTAFPEMSRQDVVERYVRQWASDRRRRVGTRGEQQE